MWKEELKKKVYGQMCAFFQNQKWLDELNKWSDRFPKQLDYFSYCSY